MTDPVISSVANPLIKRIRALDQRKHRQAEGIFLVEGIRAVWQAVQSGAPLELILVAPSLLSSESAQQMVEEQRLAGMRIVDVSGAVFESIATREHPSGLAAVVRIVRRGLDTLVSAPGSVFVALHEAGNPGNLGTILRTLDAVGGAGLITIGAVTDPYHPTAVKASMGALFTIPVVPVDTADSVLRWCRQRAIGVVTTSSHAASVDHWSAAYPDPCLLLFGSESHGLAPDLLQAGDLAVRIPMHGSVDSLNLAVSAGILLYEVRRAQEYLAEPTTNRASPQLY